MPYQIGVAHTLLVQNESHKIFGVSGVWFGRGPEIAASFHRWSFGVGGEGGYGRRGQSTAAYMAAYTAAYARPEWGSIRYVRIRQHSVYGSVCGRTLGQYGAAYGSIGRYTAAYGSTRSYRISVAAYARSVPRMVRSAMTVPDSA
eukprot:3108679-Rhodomonas_salina.2